MMRTLALIAALALAALVGVLLVGTRSPPEEATPSATRRTEATERAARETVALDRVAEASTFDRDVAAAKETPAEDVVDAGVTATVEQEPEQFDAPKSEGPAVHMEMQLMRSDRSIPEGEDAVVYLARSGDAGVAQSSHKVGDAGRFDFDVDGVAVDIEYVEVQLGGLTSGELTMPVASSDGSYQFGDVVLWSTSELHPTVQLSGRILDENGLAVEGTDCTVLMEFGDTALSGGSRQPAETEVDADGSFRIYLPDNVDGGILIAGAPDHADAVHSFDELPQTDLELVLTRQQDLTGRVIIPEGTAMEDFVVWIDRVEMSTGMSPNEDGRFTVPAAHDAVQIRISYHVSSLHLYRFDIDAGTLDSGEFGDIDLRPLVRMIRIEILDNAGTPRANAEVSVAGEFADDDSFTLSLTTDDNGVLVLVAPNELDEAELSFGGGRASTIDLRSPPASQVL